MQGAALRGAESSASGCDLAGADLRLDCLTLLGLSSESTRLGLRISLRIQITPRCAPIERIGQLTTGCRGAGCSVVDAVAELIFVAIDEYL